MTDVWGSSTTAAARRPSRWSRESCDVTLYDSCVLSGTALRLGTGITVRSLLTGTYTLTVRHQVCMVQPMDVFCWSQRGAAPRQRHSSNTYSSLTACPRQLASQDSTNGHITRTSKHDSRSAIAQATTHSVGLIQNPKHAKAIFEKASANGCRH